MMDVINVWVIVKLVVLPRFALNAKKDTMSKPKRLAQLVRPAAAVSIIARNAVQEMFALNVKMDTILRLMSPVQNVKSAMISVARAILRSLA